MREALRNSAGFLDVSGLAEDATSREVYVLFSACEGYISSRLVDEDRGAFALIEFDSQENARKAAQTRRGTTWEDGARPVMIDLRRPEENIGSPRTPRSESEFEEPNNNRGQGPWAWQHWESPQYKASAGVGNLSFPHSPRAGHRARTPSPTSRMRNRSQDARPRSVPPRSASPHGAKAEGQHGGHEWSRRHTRRGNDGHGLNPKGRRTVTNTPLPHGVTRAGGIQVRVRLEAAVDSRKIHDLEDSIRDGEKSGISPEELSDARIVLQEEKNRLVVRQAASAEHKARMKFKQVCDPSDRNAFRMKMIDTLGQALKLGEEAACLCEGAGLKKGERQLRKSLRDILDSWRPASMDGLERAMQERNVEAVKVSLAACNLLDVSGSSERDKGEEDCHFSRLTEAANRITSGETGFEDEDFRESVRQELHQLMQQGCDPRQLREVRNRAEAAGLATGIDADLFKSAENQVKELNAFEDQESFNHEIREALQIDNLKALDDAIAFGETLDIKLMPKELKELLYQAKAAARSKRVPPPRPSEIRITDQIKALKASGAAKKIESPSGSGASSKFRGGIKKQLTIGNMNRAASATR